MSKSSNNVTNYLAPQHGGPRGITLANNSGRDRAAPQIVKRSSFYNKLKHGASLGNNSMPKDPPPNRYSNNDTAHYKIREPPLLNNEDRSKSVPAARPVPHM